MKVWIINPYGNIPGEGWRDYRSTMIAHALEKAGHDTIWWVSNFEHRTKKYRTEKYCELAISPHFHIHMIPSSGYTRHISLARIHYEKTFALRFYEYAHKYERPDVIILAEPAMFVSKPVLRYVDEHNIPLVVDILDIWPELFHILFTKSLSWVGHILFFPLYRRRMNLLIKADAIVAVARDYLEIALHTAPEKPSEVVYLGVDVGAFKKNNKSNNDLLKRLRLPEKRAGDIWVIYAGTLGNNYDIDTILQAAAMLGNDAPNVRFVIVGEGPMKQNIVRAIDEKRLTNTHFLGFLKADALTELYVYCDLALSTYRGLSTVAMPVKAFDYMAAGLPVINSLKKDWGRLVEHEKIGLQYKPENPISLSEAIKSLSSDISALKKMSNTARKVAERYDCHIQHDKLVKFIENTVMK